MNNIRASIVAIQLLLGGIQALVTPAGPEIMKMDPMIIPKTVAQRIVHIVVETPTELFQQHMNDMFSNQ